MGEFVLPLLFLVTVFVAFGLVHRNRRCGNCTGACDKTECKEK